MAAVLIVSNLVHASLLGIKLDDVLAGNESAAQVDLLLSGIAACKGYHLLRIVFSIYLDILDIDLVPKAVEKETITLRGLAKHMSEHQCVYSRDIIEGVNDDNITSRAFKDQCSLATYGVEEKIDITPEEQDPTKKEYIKKVTPLDDWIREQTASQG